MFVAGGVESISCVQNEANQHMLRETWLTEHKPEIYWPMLQTAENVAKRYGISRERRTSTACRASSAPPRRAAAGQFNDEIVPMTTTMGVADKATGRAAHEGSDDRRRRGHPRRHHLRGRGEDQARRCRAA